MLKADIMHSIIVTRFGLYPGKPGRYQIYTCRVVLPSICFTWVYTATFLPCTVLYKVDLLSSLLPLHYEDAYNVSKNFLTSQHAEQGKHELMLSVMTLIFM